MSHRHLVQFYGADQNALVREVATYIAEGVDAGEAVIVVTNRERRDAFFRELDHLRGEAVPGSEDARLVVLDSGTTLESLYVQGSLNANRFDEVVGNAVRKIASRSRSHRVRAYGDIVDTLWHRPDRAGAIELERYWNDLQAQVPFDLYCGYAIDVFGDEFEAAEIAPVLSEHSDVVSGGSCELHSALDYAMYETLGWTCPEMPDAQAAILWIRSNLPEYALEILQRARQYAPGPA